MELVYLWVDNYKNIRNQGFNFLPRFECEFKDGNLTICDKKKNECKNNEYLENFFGEKINFTAIIGENGTGKSRILNFILELLENNDANDNNYILIVRNNNTNFNISNFLKKDGLEDLLLENFIEQITYYSYSNTSQKKLNAIFLSKKEINNHLMKLSDKSFKLTSFMYLPEKIKVKLISPDKRLKIIFENDEHLNYTLNLIYSNNKPVGIIKQEFEEDFLKITDDYKKFLVIEYLKYYKKLPDIKLANINWKNELSDVINKEKFDLYFKNIENDFSELKAEEKEIYIKYIDFFEFEFTDEKKRKYSELSHGEQVLFGQMLNIYSYSLEEDTNFIFLFDEPEISLHPNWQKRYIQELYNLVVKLEKNVHFIFTSHSPFLLSDIPKENIIFLDKFEDKETKKKYPILDIEDLENGNCINVSKHKELQTFGANIHTLLSDGFFMSDGLMGEFAKEKINQVYNFIVQKDTNFIKTKKEAQNIINLIGEPLIKKQLQKLFDETFDKSNLTLDDEIELLEKKLNALKELKNDKN